MSDNIYKVINPNSQTEIILTCEHASGKIPEGYDNLGLTKKDLNRHIAFDKGCAELTETLAKQLDCFAVLGGYSRLFIDLNRGEHEEALIVSESDKTVIDGNLNLDNEERNNRITKYYRPYYQQINQQIEKLSKLGKTPILLSIHSFTPQLQGGEFRPWNAGILYHLPQKLASFLADRLSKVSDKNIGENVPYDLRRYNTGAAIFCGENKGLDYAVLEIRDSEFDNMVQGVREWCDLLAPWLKEYVKSQKQI